MRQMILFGIITGTLAIAANAQVSVRNFKVSVSSTTVAEQGGLAAVTTKIKNQLDALESQVNTGVGSTQFDFVVDQVSEYSSTDLLQQISVAHPSQDFHLLYETAPSNNGGWYYGSQAIFMTWSGTTFGGPFGSTATSSLLRLISLGLGGVDLAQGQVSAANNPVNGVGYTAPTSVLTSPFTASGVYDSYNSALIRAEYQTKGFAQQSLVGQFPSAISIQTLDSMGIALRDARVRLYPVAWGSSTVTSTPALDAMSGSNGKVAVSANLFGTTVNGPRQLEKANFLVGVDYNGATKYTWLPVGAPQLAKLSGSQDYVLNVSLPVKAPETSLNLGTVNGYKSLMVTNQAEFTIDQFPNWQFSKVIVAIDAVNAPMSGTVYVNGNSYGTVSGWYQRVLINQSAATPILLRFNASFPQSISIRWWVEN